MPMSRMAGASTSSEALMASIPVETFRKLTGPANFDSTNPIAAIQKKSIPHSS